MFVSAPQKISQASWQQFASSKPTEGLASFDSVFWMKRSKNVLSL